MFGCDKMQKVAGRKLYSLTEFYRILYLGLRTHKYLSKAQKIGSINTWFVERIMLAVTEVNQCPLCSYGHTKIALEAGMGNEEIQDLLAGSTDTVPDDEIAAVLFAQHYADSRGNPSKDAWQRIVDIYGEPKAKGILGAIRMIMLGNAFGIVLNSLKDRLKGRPDNRSNLLYEIGIILAFIVFLPVALIHTLISNLFGFRIV